MYECWNSRKAFNNFLVIRKTIVTVRNILYLLHVKDTHIFNYKHSLGIRTFDFLRSLQSKSDIRLLLLQSLWNIIIYIGTYWSIVNSGYMHLKKNMFINLKFSVSHLNIVSTRSSATNIHPNSIPGLFNIQYCLTNAHIYSTRA